MMEFTVLPDNEDPYKVTATSRDVYVWEKVTKNSLGTLGSNVTMTAMFQLAHIAAKRQHLFTGSLDDFVASNDIDFEAEIQDADPTPPGASAGL